MCLFCFAGPFPGLPRRGDPGQRSGPDKRFFWASRNQNPPPPQQDRALTQKLTEKAPALEPTLNRQAYNHSRNGAPDAMTRVDLLDAILRLWSEAVCVYHLRAHSRGPGHAAQDHLSQPPSRAGIAAEAPPSLANQPSRNAQRYRDQDWTVWQVLLFPSDGGILCAKRPTGVTPFLGLMGPWSSMTRNPPPQSANQEAHPWPSPFQADSLE